MIKMALSRTVTITAVALIAWATYGLTRYDPTCDDEVWSSVTPSTPHSTEVETAVFGFG